MVIDEEHLNPERIIVEYLYPTFDTPQRATYYFKTINGAFFFALCIKGLQKYQNYTVTVVGDIVSLEWVKP